MDGSPHPRPNPYLSAPVYALTHFDPGQSDTLPHAVERGTFRVDLPAEAHVPGGPVNIMNLSAADPAYMWATSTTRVAYVRVADGDWTAVAETALPGVTQFDPTILDSVFTPAYSNEDDVEQAAHRAFGEKPETTLSNGLYNLVDSDNTLFINAGTAICAIGLKDAADPAAGLAVERSINMADHLPPAEFPGYGSSVRLIGMNLTYDGHLVIGAFNGVAIIDRRFEQEPVFHQIERDQFISNSFAVDEDSGIYVASGSFRPGRPGIFRRLVWTGERISDDENDGAWASPYDGGDWAPAVKVGTGTGATPTLLGFGPEVDHIVVLTDGADRMKIVAFWRDAIPADAKQQPDTQSRRIAGQLQITAGLPTDTPWIQSEQSVMVNRSGVFVVNNVIPEGNPDKLLDVMLNGPVTEPAHGMERVEWDHAAHEWRSVWVRGDLASTSMVPVASSASGIVFINGYSNEDGWEITGLDWDTGETVYRAVFGRSNLGNGAYALIQFAPDGDLLFNSIAGPYRIRNS